VPPFGHPYVQPELTLFASTVYAVFGLMIVTIVVSYARRARQMDGGFAITGTLGFWGACMVNDMCVGLGLYWTPWLQPLGFVVFGGTFGSLLMRRLVRSQRHVERNAGELHALVDARTDELRRKDLELAHGARLATLGALAGGIAHEVKEPLAAIDAHVKELRHAWRDATRPGAFAEHLADAQRSVERIRRVVAELLQLARREEGRSGVHDLPTIVAGVLPIAGYELRRRARIETHLASAPAVSGDAAMLSQIALNLLVGAIHAFPDEVQPSRRALIHLTTEERAGAARLVVEDNAPTIPGDVAIDLFEASDASGRERERRVQLAVTKQLVERHGGTLRIDSGAHGTRVSVEFPAAPEPGAPA
jgi:C4-dicarboxylate-specific signal transduction histidine kinase